MRWRFCSRQLHGELPTSRHTAYNQPQRKKRHSEVGMNNRCVLYLRVSDERQVDGFSLAAQERGGAALAVKEGLEIWKVYVDGGQSGKDGQRDAFQEMLSDLQRIRSRERITTVIIHKLDRFMRDLRLTLNFEHDLRRMKIRLMSVVNAINTDTPEGRLQFQMEGSLAEWFRGNLSREVKKGLTEKAVQGLWVGPVPFGYSKQNDRLVISEDANTVRAIFRLYATGKHSYISIAEELNKTTSGMLNWRTGERYPFGRESVRGIIRSRAYIGKVGCGGIEYDGQHEPMITETLWNDCATTRDRNTSKGGKPQRHEPGMLLGIGHCAVCGGKLWQHVSGKPTIVVRYYRCSGATRCDCTQGLVSMKHIDEQMLDLVSSLMLSDGVIDRVVALLQHDSLTPAPRRSVDREMIGQQLTRLTEVYIEGRMTKENYEQRYQYLERQIALASVAVSIPSSVDLQKAIAVLRDMPLLLNHATPSERSQLARLLFERVWIADKQITAITPHEVYAHLIDAMTASCVGGVADGTRQPAQHSNRAPRYTYTPQWLALKIPRTSQFAKLCSA